MKEGYVLIPAKLARAVLVLANTPQEEWLSKKEIHAAISEMCKDLDFNASCLAAHEEAGAD